jgi:hypothetical protein
MYNSYTIALRLFAGLIALAGMQVASSQPALQPGPQITGYDWQEQWVTTLNTCTKNTLNQYEALSYISNTGSTSFKVQSLTISGPDANYFKLDNSDPITSVTSGLEIRPGEANKRAQKILFTPDAERNYMALMGLITEAGDTVMSILQGAGIESHINLADSDFGGVMFMGPESTRVSGDVDLTIEPTRPTTITEIRITGPDAADFRFNWASAMAPYNALPSTNPAMWANIPVSTFINIPIDFMPTSPGSKTAMLEVIGDFSECDTSFALLTGNAITPLSVSDIGVDQVALTTDRNGTVTLSLAYAAEVTLDLHDASGNRIARLAEGTMEAGTHRISSDNIQLASGVYLYRLSVGGTVRTGRVVVVR